MFWRVYEIVALAAFFFLPTWLVMLMWIIDLGYWYFNLTNTPRSKRTPFL